MTFRKQFIHLGEVIVQGAIQSSGIENPIIRDSIESKVDQVVTRNDEVGKEIDELVKQLSHRPAEPKAATALRSMLRPSITLLLTIVFISLIFFRLGIWSDSVPTNDENRYIFEIFLAIYGPIIGFWFGERKLHKEESSNN